MSEFSHRPSLDELNSGEIGQALSRRIFRQIYRKLGEADAPRDCLMQGTYGINSDYNRLTLIAYPVEVGMINHAIMWDSATGSWQRDGLDYEIYCEDGLVIINRVAMLAIPKQAQQLPEDHGTMTDEELGQVLNDQLYDHAGQDISVRDQAQKIGLTKVDRGEAKNLFRAIRTAELLY